jgi:UMF1 family MFS transporter
VIEAQPPQGAPLAKARATAWVLYDLANTIYAASLTYLFTPYFTERFPEDRTMLGVVTTISMVVSGFTGPLLGALTDRNGRARGYLAVATIVNVIAIMLWGFGGSAMALLSGLFVANFAYQTALTFYNSLLPSVAPPERAGWMSGVGTGVGYFGNIVVLVSLIVLPPASFLEVAPYLVFAGLAFLLFGLPCMLLVRDLRPPLAGDQANAIRESARSLLCTLRKLPHNRPLCWFLLGNFFLVDVLNTAIQFFGDYVKEVFRAPYKAGTLSWFGIAFRPDGLGMVAFLAVLGLLLSLLAFVFGLALGRYTDRHPLGVMKLSGIGLGIGLLGGALFGGGNTELFTLSLVGFGALGLAGIWTAGRKLLMELAPPDQLGEYFGLYGITVKISVIGSTAYAAIATYSGPQMALATQGIPLLAGLWFLWRVRLPNRRHHLTMEQTA